MLDAMQSVRDKFKTMKKSEAGVDQISTDSKPGTSKQNNDLNTKPNTQELNIQASEHIDEPMETDFCGPSLPPQLGQSVQSKHGSDPNGLDHTSKQSKQPTWVYLVKAKKKHLDKRKHKVWAKYVSQSSSSEESESSVPVKKSSQPKRAPSEQGKQQTDPDLIFIGR